MQRAQKAKATCQRGLEMFLEGERNIPGVSQEPSPRGHEVRIPCSLCSGGRPSPPLQRVLLLACLGLRPSSCCIDQCAFLQLKGAKKRHPTQKCSVCLSRALAAGLHLETSRAALPPAIGIPGKATTKKKTKTLKLHINLIFHRVSRKCFQSRSKFRL